MRLSLFLTCAVLAILMVSVVSATFSTEFINNETVYYNVSYSTAQPNATPIALPIVFAIIGGGLILLSFMLRSDQGSAVLAIVAVPAILISGWKFLNIDIVTGYGAMGLTSATGDYTFAIMESHTIYQMYPEAIFMLVLFGISLLNVYRVIFAPISKSEEDI